MSAFNHQNFSSSSNFQDFSSCLNERQDVDAVPSDMDLVKIAQAVGLNWELLGPHLGLSKAMIDHIKMDNDTSQKRIYQMLYNWREYQGPNSSKQNLFTAFGNQPSTSIDWETLGLSFPDALKYKAREENNNVFTAAFLKQTPNEKQLSRMAQKIGKEYRSLGFELGMSSVELGRIEADHRNGTAADKITAMLLDWLRKSACDATFDELYRAMIKTGIDPNNVLTGL